MHCKSVRLVKMQVGERRGGAAIENKRARGLQTNNQRALGCGGKRQGLRLRRKWEGTGHANVPGWLRTKLPAPGKAGPASGCQGGAVSKGLSLLGGELLPATQAAQRRGHGRKMGAQGRRFRCCRGGEKPAEGKQATGATGGGGAEKLGRKVQGESAGLGQGLEQSTKSARRIARWAKEESTPHSITGDQKLS
jgi:hypothetical protein